MARISEVGVWAKNWNCRKTVSCPFPAQPRRVPLATIFWASNCESAGAENEWKLPGGRSLKIDRVDKIDMGARGQAKTGGRKAGTPNKDTAALQRAVEQSVGALAAPL
jgi:hypothetical protein